MKINVEFLTFLGILVNLTLTEGLCPTVSSLWSFDYKQTPMPVIMTFQKYRTSSSLYQCAHMWAIDCQCFTIENRYIASPNTKISNPATKNDGWATLKGFSEDGKPLSSSNTLAIKWKEDEYCRTGEIKQKYWQFARSIDFFDSYRFISAKELELGQRQKCVGCSIKPVARLLRQKYSQMKIKWDDSELGPMRRPFEVVLDLPNALSVNS